MTHTSESPASSEASPARPALGAGGHALRGLVALLGFLAGAAVLGRAVPPHVPVVTPKKEHLAEHRDEYSVVFVGTSIMYRHIVPEIFAAEMASLGRDDKGFNFGAPHMTLGEAMLLVDWIASLKARNIKTVVIDVELFPDSGKHNYFTSRHVWWHTPTETWYALESDFRGGAGKRAFQAARVDLEAMALNVTGIGRISELFQTSWDQSFRNAEEDDEDVETSEGYRSLEDLRSKSVDERRRKFVRERAKFEATIAARKAREGRPRGIGGYQRLMLERIVARLEAAGIRPLLYEGPDYKPPMRLTGKRLTSLPRMSFNDPNAYPELYRFENRFDWGHLNEAGARIFTHHLARELARISEGKPKAPRADDSTDEDDEAR